MSDDHEPQCCDYAWHWCELHGGKAEPSGCYACMGEALTRAQANEMEADVQCDAAEHRAEAAEQALAAMTAERDAREQQLSEIEDMILKDAADKDGDLSLGFRVLLQRLVENS